MRHHLHRRPVERVPAGSVRRCWPASTRHGVVDGTTWNVNCLAMPARDPGQIAADLGDVGCQRPGRTLRLCPGRSRTAPGDASGHPTSRCPTGWGRCCWRWRPGPTRYAREPADAVNRTLGTLRSADPARHRRRGDAVRPLLVDYELNAIPQASATLAVGRDFDGKPSPVHALAANFVDRVPAQIYITPNALGYDQIRPCSRATLASRRRGPDLRWLRHGGRLHPLPGPGAVQRADGALAVGAWVQLDLLQDQPSDEPGSVLLRGLWVRWAAAGATFANLSLALDFVTIRERHQRLLGRRL